MHSAGAAGAARALLPHGSQPNPAAIAAAFATLESLCDNPSLAELHASLSRCIRELGLGVYCCKEWLGFNSSNQAVPFFEILKEAGQQIVEARAALGNERKINMQLQQQVRCQFQHARPVVFVTRDWPRSRTASPCDRR